MFHHLLVPLDGSPMAEAAMPVLEYLARTLGARVTFLHIIEPRSKDRVHGQSHLTSPARAHDYLAEISSRTVSPQGEVHVHVHTGKVDNVASDIVRHAVKLGADLILLCTHGLGSIRHRLFGTIVERVIRLGNIPVLLIPTPPTVDHPYCCRRALVPLDGNPDHEHGLSNFTNLGPDLNSVHLLMVIPSWSRSSPTHQITSRILPGTTAKLLEASIEPAASYLNALKAMIAPAIPQVSTQIVRGDPALAILSAAQALVADVIILGTHGTSHLDAFWSGSVTPRLIRQSTIPLLLVPV